MENNEHLDLSVIPRYEVDFESLASATSEEPFLHASFELLKEASSLLVTAAGTLDEQHTDGFTRNEAILVGHLIRMAKLMRSIIAGIADCHGGDQQMQLVRQFLDSASTLKYLLADPSDTSRFDVYVLDSLIGEKEFLKDIEEEATMRGGQKLDIELRIERSIQRTFDRAGVSESDIPSRNQLKKENRWPTARERLKLLGPTAYSAYRMGSGAIHGSWHDIERNHLELVDGKFHPDPGRAPERPQPLLAMALAGTDIAREYIDKCVPEAAHVFHPRLGDFIERLGRANDLHEAFLAEMFNRSSADIE